MKKIISAILLSMFVLVLPFSLIGCKKSDPIVGTWYCSGYQEIRIATGEIVGEETYTQDEVEKITFHKNKKFTVEGIEDLEATWKKDGNNYIVTFKESGKTEKITYYLKNGKLILEQTYNDGTIKSIDFYERVK